MGMVGPPPPPMPGMGPPPPPLNGMGFRPPPLIEVLPYGLKPKRKWQTDGPPLKRANWKVVSLNLLHKRNLKLIIFIRNKNQRVGLLHDINKYAYIYKITFT